MLGWVVLIERMRDPTIITSLIMFKMAASSFFWPTTDDDDKWLVNIRVLKYTNTLGRHVMDDHRHPRPCGIFHVGISSSAPQGALRLEIFNAHQP